MGKKFWLCLCSLFLCFFSTFAQNRIISGNVVDSLNQPLSGVSVSVQGMSKMGTLTDNSGHYQLSVPANARELKFSMIGYKSVIKSITENEMETIILLNDAGSGLSDVVVTGISTVKRKYYAGAATSINVVDIENKPVGSFDQLLQGRVPGLLALTESGQPGNNTDVTIRGTSSISGGSSPLYIIDGIPVEQNAFQGYNQNDFATFEVLKDAAATALYGSRASGGVIVITTKKGKAGKLKVQYDGQMGAKSKPKFGFTMMNSKQLLEAQKEYGLVAGSSASTTNMPGWYYSLDNPANAGLSAAEKSAYTGILDSLGSINTNWEDLLFRTGTFSNHQISLSGGSDKLTFYSSINLYNEQGTANNTDMQRVQAQNNISYKDDRFKFNVTSNLAYIKRDFPYVTGFYTNSPFLAMLLSPTYVKPYNPDGSYNVGDGSTKYLVNDELDQAKYDISYNNQLKATFGIQSSYDITKHLVLSLTSGIDYRETQNTAYKSQLAYYSYSSKSLTGKAGSQNESLSRVFTGDVRPMLEYSNTFNKVHDVDFSVMGEYIKEFDKSFGMVGYGIDPRTPNTPAAITQSNATNQLFPVLSGAKSQNALLSGLITGRYTYSSKYTISGSYRYDGSSRLPKDNRWVGFYSVSAIWDIKQEDFLKNSSAVNVLRLRYSYGGSGNNTSANFPGGDGSFNLAANSFPYQPTYENGTYGGLTTIVLSNPGNPSLTWERVFTGNLGLDYGFFDNRLYGSIDVYNKTTKDLFVEQGLSSTAGQGNGATLTVNAGKMRNRGIEWDISGDVIKNRNLTWTLYTTGSYNKNEILSLGGVTPYVDGTTLLQVGKPYGSQYEVKFAGIDQATGKALYYTKDGQITSNYSTDDAVEKYGTWIAPWQGGFGTQLTYKNFGFNILFSWQAGASRYDNMQYFLENPTGFLLGGYNQATSLNFWQKPGDVATSPSPLYATNFSSQDIHSASFLRLRDVTLSYVLPQNLISSWKFISSLKIYVEASNLFIWTHWKGVDPEAGAQNLNQAEYPNPSAITGGLTISL